MAGGVKASVKDSMVSDIVGDLNKFLATNVIAIKELQSLAGKLNHAAGLLIILRPFMEPLWAAIKEGLAGKKTHAPTNTVWTKQIHPRCNGSGLSSPKKVLAWNVF